MNRENKVVLITLVITLGILASFLWMPLYIAGPDGLEQVQFDLTGNNEYEPKADFSYKGAIFPDYNFLSGESSYLNSWLIGLIGIILTFGLLFGVLKLVLIRKETKSNEH